jgi:hypothetical protein
MDGQIYLCFLRDRHFSNFLKALRVELVRRNVVAVRNYCNSLLILVVKILEFRSRI